MKVVILAGGFGTRLSEETELKPKPIVEIGGKPILWHIMKIYATQGFNEFIICLGYKGYIIKKYFADYFLHNSDMTVDLENNTMKYHKSRSENWKITLVDTGLKTLTGGRIKKIQEYVGNEEFMLTYGDGVANIDLKKLLTYHKENNKIATMTTIRISTQFGTLSINNGLVEAFREKSVEDGNWINGGFFVLKPEIFKYIEGNVMFEKEPLEKVVKNNQLAAYEHTGFWKCMDHLRDKIELEKLYSEESCPWKVW